MSSHLRHGVLAMELPETMIPLQSAIFSPKLFHHSASPARTSVNHESTASENVCSGHRSCWERSPFRWRERLGESFVLSRPISWRFTPLALDTLRKQRIRIVTSPSQRARVSADIEEPRGHQPPRLRSGSLGSLPSRGPHQIRTRRFPPSGSAVAVTHGRVAQIWTVIRGTGRGNRSS